MDTGKPLTRKTIRVLVADDHPAVRQGLTLLLEPEGITVCAEASSHAEALTLTARLRPDVVLVDLSLGEDDGLALIADLNRQLFYPLVYSMHEDGRHVESAIAAGAFGYVTKREVQGVLVQAIAEAAAGRRYISPRAAAALAEHIAVGHAKSPIDRLSHQEKQVYRFLEEGNAIRDIAAALKISTRTVESYCERICAKLGLNGMRELRHYASKNIRSDSQ